MMNKYHLEDLGVDGRIIQKTNLQEMGWEVVYWIALAQGRDRWRAFLNEAMIPSGSIKCG
jgi:hypothetical protein